MVPVSIAISWYPVDVAAKAAVVDIGLSRVDDGKLGSVHRAWLAMVACNDGAGLEVVVVGPRLGNGGSWDSSGYNRCCIVWFDQTHPDSESVTKAAAVMRS